MESCRDFMTQTGSHFVYILRCQGNRLYTGYAIDPYARYSKHCEGVAAHFTRAFPPLELLCVIPVESRSQGLKLESAIKKLTRSRKDLLLVSMQTLGVHVALLLLEPSSL